MRTLLFCFPIISLFTGCHHSSLSCRTEYLYPDHLASEKTLTPDPCRLCFYGQQVILHWNLPHCCPPDELVLHVRYGTREQGTFRWSLHANARGYRIYRLVNDDYWSKEGIVSYKAELFCGEELIDAWTHHLWTDVIEVRD